MGVRLGPAPINAQAMRSSMATDQAPGFRMPSRQRQRCREPVGGHRQFLGER